MGLRLYNTLSRKVEDFTPIVPGKAGFYGCGPTVYNFAHIGNLRAYVFQDTLSRGLRWLGFEVTHVMNITDVGHLSGDVDSGEDKMVKTAEERGKSVLEIAKFYTDAFFADCGRLNIRRPDVVCPATAHIGDMIDLIKRIEANGFTYQAGGNLYFDISKLADYGKLARFKLDELKAGARIEVDANKRNPQDFVLWFTKSKFEGQAMVWDSPWGRGYPGWHIECSAMSMKYLGEQFDIHSGGIDHIQVHHTNEIAQSEAATGKSWVNYWLHNEFLLMGSTKMSKSSGGFITLSKLVDEGFEPLDYRYFLLGGHYRSQLSFTIEALNSAKSSRASLVARLGKLAALAKEAGKGEAVTALLAKAGTAALEGKLPITAATALETAGTARSWLESFNSRIEEDLNTPRALAELWTCLKDESVAPADALAAALAMDSVLGLSLDAAIRAGLEGKTGAGGVEAAHAAEDPAFIAEIDALVAERLAAKKAKDFGKADSIRNALKERGILIEDSPAGSTWRRA